MAIRFDHPLRCVGEIAVKPVAAQHPHVREAAACASVLVSSEQSGVIGTENTAACELYGWRPNIGPHVDNTGFVYLAPIRVGRSSVRIHGVTLNIRIGGVYRLNDWVRHWTRDSELVVALFVGSFEKPCDARAISILQQGAFDLAHKWHSAPRSRPGFRVPLEREVWADTNGGPELLPLDDARRRGLMIARCGKCSRYAAKLDPHFPYMVDLNLCNLHWRADANQDIQAA